MAGPRRRRRIVVPTAPAREGAQGLPEDRYLINTRADYLDFVRGIIAEGSPEARDMPLSSDDVEENDQEPN
ncbi:hypothetical protein LTS00_017753, partial [Friedmanniomyces endolithicus]